MKRLLLGLIIIGLLTSCEKKTSDSFKYPEITGTSSREADDKLLGELYQEILDLSTQFKCMDSKEWKYTAIGSKACGGPTGYIAYSLKTNETGFLSKVQHYSQQQNRYNVKWGVVSDCSIPPQPIAVECEGGVPKFIYEY